MEDMLYWGMLAAVGLAAMMFYRNNNSLLVIVSLLVGGLVIYSHETGRGYSDVKNEIHDSIDEPAHNYSKQYDTDMYDAEKAKEKVR